MKKKRIIIWSVITLLAVMAVLEIFDLHPSFTVGRYGFRWTGISHMGFTSGNATVSSVNIQAAFRVYGFGPVMIFKSL